MKHQETCRTCLKVNGGYRNIFEDTQNNRLISELIMECVPIMIQREDKLTNNICNICMEKLNSVSDFREMVIKSNEILSRQLQNDKFDENETKLKYEIKKELQANEAVNYSFGNVGENISVACWKEINTGDEVKDEIKSTQTDTILTVHPNENIAELYFSMADTSEDSNARHKHSNIIETTSKKVPKRFRYGNYDKKQLKVIDDNPDCKRIMESGLNRQEKSDAKVLCQYCNKSYSFRYYVAIHAHTHMGNLPFKCELCEYRAPVQNMVRSHMRRHSQTKSMLCTQCGKAFATKDALKVHEVTHSNSTPFKCEICGKAFKYLISLQKHDLGHKDVREFICDECGKSFRHKIDLSNHKAIHANEKKFECDTCGKKFLLKKRLASHVKSHSGLRPFACDVCGKRFGNKVIWRRHTWIHTGEKPFSCEVCGKKFRQRSCITTHMKIHTGETPYACKICPQRFKYSHLLSNHMQIHEVEENKKLKKITEKKESCVKLLG